MALAEPIREQVMDNLYQALYALKTDTAGAYFYRPAEVSRQPVPFDECKRYPTYFVVDGAQEFEGRPGGDHECSFQALVWGYLKDSKNVSRARSRAARDILQALHVARTRGSLTHDTRIRSFSHDGGTFAPFSWFVIEFEIPYRMQGSVL